MFLLISLVPWPNLQGMLLEKLWKLLPSQQQPRLRNFCSNLVLWVDFCLVQPEPCTCLHCPFVELLSSYLANRNQAAGSRAGRNVVRSGRQKTSVTAFNCKHGQQYTATSTKQYDLNTKEWTFGYVAMISARSSSATPTSTSRKRTCGCYSISNRPNTLITRFVK